MHRGIEHFGFQQEKAWKWVVADQDKILLGWSLNISGSINFQTRIFLWFGEKEMVERMS
jgi:hypothetical protein